MGAVYAMDLLGFGSSQKPEGVTYDPHLWKDQVVDFVNTLVTEPCVLLGNSIGSQVGPCFCLQQWLYRYEVRESAVVAAALLLWHHGASQDCPVA